MDINTVFYKDRGARVGGKMVNVWEGLLAYAYKKIKKLRSQKLFS